LPSLKGKSTLNAVVSVHSLIQRLRLLWKNFSAKTFSANMHEERSALKDPLWFAGSLSRIASSYFATETCCF